MTDQRNMFLAIIISMIILFTWDYFFAPKPVEQNQLNAIQAPENLLPNAPNQIIDNSSDALIVTEDRNSVLSKQERIPIHTQKLNGSVSLKGLRFDDLTLASYRETTDPSSKEIELLSPIGSPNPYYAEIGWISADRDILLPSKDTVWTTSANNTVLSSDETIVMTWKNQNGLEFRRSISIDNNYMFQVYNEVTNNGDTSISLYPYGLVTRIDKPKVEGFFILHEGPLGVFQDTLTELDYDDLTADESRKEFSSTGGWLGFTDKYWLTVLAYDQSAKIEAAFRHINSRGNRDRYQTEFRTTEPIIIAPGKTDGTMTYLFSGAKEVEILDNYTETLGIKRFDLAIDFGWFYFLTKPFFYSLIWLKSVLGNFGLAILALTVALRLLLFPLANKQFRAMTKLKKLQPEMKELQTKYSDDKTRMNQELMELYKREKANPAAGCLPILVQIPIFFALYKVLFVTIEMRHEPFYGWINDLSARDPTSIFNLFGLFPFDVPSFLVIGAWPIIMGITMWLQQKLNPAPTDPMQAQIMSFLPIIFTFLLATFPAGLVIYWAWSNALGILQQWFIMRQAGVKV